MERSLVEERSVLIGTGKASIAGDLAVPQGARGIVLFAHGSGSGRHSPRNRFVAQGLWPGSLATLLVDLLTQEEEEVDLVTREHRFDIDLLARRLASAIDWLTAEADTADLPVGIFGASTGAAAALRAAAERESGVAAVVSRGGRPDLAGEALSRVAAPTLLIVGGDDAQVIELNEQAREQMLGDVELEIVPGAGHLFEEPGKLERVVELARAWFERHLKGISGRGV